MEDIWKQFKYKEVNNEVIITNYFGEEIEVEVPNYIDGKPVVRIGDYAFSECRHIILVSLPESIKEIGNHAFYNCRKLNNLSASDRIHEMEDGAFKNCEVLSNISLNIMIGKTTCLKNLLSETNNELHVTLRYVNEGQSAKLVFPKYLHGYEEYTQARIINQITYGAGVHYRECMDERDVDYKKYDNLFKYAKANDSKETACLIAMGRLYYPYKLNKEAENTYMDYLLQELNFFVGKLLRNEDMVTIEQLAELHMFSDKNINDMLEIAHNMNKVEAINYFMHYKQANFGVKEWNFEL